MNAIFDSLVGKLLELYIIAFSSTLGSLKSGFMFVVSAFMWILGACLAVVAIAIPILLIFAMFHGLVELLRKCLRTMGRVTTWMNAPGRRNASVWIVWSAVVLCAILLATFNRL